MSNLKPPIDVKSEKAKMNPKDFLKHLKQERSKAREDETSTGPADESLQLNRRNVMNSMLDYQTPMRKKVNLETTKNTANENFFKLFAEHLTKY